MLGPLAAGLPLHDKLRPDVLSFSDAEVEVVAVMLQGG